jgi:dienelactone hydrolase
MKIKFLIYSALTMLSLFFLIAFTKTKTVSPMIKEETISYQVDGVTVNGYIAYDDNLKGKRPAILVVPEWWGWNDYVKMRARKLAELGYIAIALDIYGNGKIATNPKEAQESATPFYQNPNMGKSRIDAALLKIKSYPQTDATKVAAIGYCFGGSLVLNAAKLGADLIGVVSFHGGLAGVPADKSMLKAKILVCHGGSDQFVLQKDVDTFKHQLDSIGATYTFKVYANATHAFSNPDATKTGKAFNMPIAYNAEADQNSWNDMKAFFNILFK